VVEDHSDVDGVKEMVLYYTSISLFVMQTFIRNAERFKAYYPPLK